MLVVADDDTPGVADSFLIVGAAGVLMTVDTGLEFSDTPEFLLHPSAWCSNALSFLGRGGRSPGLGAEVVSVDFFAPDTSAEYAAMRSLSDNGLTPELMSEGAVLLVLEEAEYETILGCCCC